MAIPRTILYPVDFSERCLQIWPAVASMARTLRAPVTMIHAFDGGCQETDLAIVANEVAAIRQQMVRKLDSYPVNETEMLDLRRDVMDGSAEECILRRASEMDDPIIMMPTRGQTRFRTLLLGSVTAGVLHDSPWPVWTDAHREEHTAHSGQYGAMVCAVDMGEKTHQLLRMAREFSEVFGAKLHVVHSVRGIDPTFPSSAADRAHAFLVQEASELFPAHCRAAGFDAHLEIVEEVSLADGVVASVTRHGADLLIIGRGSIQGFLGRLRTNAHELIRRSPCPVLSL